MIQRVQTVWLFFIVLLNAGMFFLPVVGNDAAYSFPCEWIVNIETGLTVLLAIVVIFLYKRRHTQITGCYGILIIQFVLCASLFLLVPKAVNATIFSTAWNLPILFPLISLVLSVLAIRAIKKDEKLVRSLDRLR